MLAETERLAALLHEPGPGARVQLAVAPCSPFSVTGRLMEESAALARRLGLPLHTHLAETLEEEAYCIELYGCRPVEYLDRLGWLADDVWCAHCVHLSEADIAQFACDRHRRRPLPDLEPAARRRRRAGARHARRRHPRRPRRRRLGVERARRPVPRGEAGAARGARPRRRHRDDGARRDPARHPRRRGGAPARRHRLARARQVRRLRGLAHRRPRARRRRRSRRGHRLRRPASRRPAGRRRRGGRPRRRARQRRRGRDRAGASRPSANVHSDERLTLDPRARHGRRRACRRRHRRAAARRRADRPRARPTPTAAPASPRRSSSGATGSSSTRRRRSSAGSSYELELDADRHYHVPLLVSPFSCASYRGS